MGKLQEMLDLQRKLQERLNYDIDALDVRDRTAFIKEFSIHVNQEMNEMLYELPFFKPWKNYDSLTVEDVAECNIKARQEFVDMIHFVLNIALALGLDEDELYKMYCDKNQVNHRRQDDGY